MRRKVSTRPRNLASAAVRYGRIVDVAKPLRTLRSIFLAALVLLAPGVASAIPYGDIWVSEVMHNPGGFDWGKEWVELYNIGGTVASLDNYELRWGYDDWSENVLSLAGESIAAGGTFIIGGPTSNAQNGNPVFDLVYNMFFIGNDPFNNNAFGVGLFDLTVSTTLPVNAVIYGSVNTDLVDEQGNTPAPVINTTPAGESIEFDGFGWVPQTAPNPNAIVLTPEPGTGVLLGFGMCLLALRPRPYARMGIVTA